MTELEFSKGFERLQTLRFSGKITREQRAEYFNQLKNIHGTRWNLLVSQCIKLLLNFPVPSEILEMYNNINWNEILHEKKIICDKCSNTGLIVMIHPENKNRYSVRCYCGINKNPIILSLDKAIANGYTLDWQYQKEYKGVKL